ncbi:hypothetical protein ACLOJK_022309 [Asimina triloba]
MLLIRFAAKFDSGIARIFAVICQKKKWLALKGDGHRPLRIHLLTSVYCLAAYGCHCRLIVGHNDRLLAGWISPNRGEGFRSISSGETHLLPESATTHSYRKLIWERCCPDFMLVGEMRSCRITAFPYRLP